MRSGSSENDCSALAGVLNTFFAKSSSPPNGSINSGSAPVSSSAMELTVKSRLERSPSMLSPNSTSGLREFSSYFSDRYVVTSTVTSPSLAATVPKRIPVSQILSAHALRIFFVSCGCASVVKSKSFPSRPKIASRTGPPTSARRKPLAVKAWASDDAAGAFAMRERIANSAAAPKLLFSALTIDKRSRVLFIYDPGTWCGQRRYEEKA